MTTLTAYTVAHFLIDMGWSDNGGTTFEVRGMSADYVYDIGQLTLADAVAAGADSAEVFAGSIINRSADANVAYASPPVHISASASATVTQLLIVREPSGDGQICAQIDIPDLDVLDTDEVLVAWPDLGNIWDIGAVTLAPAIVSIAKITNGLTDFVVRAWGDDVIGWEDDGDNGFFLVGLDATYTYDPVAHITLADIGSAGATVYFGLDLPTFSSGRTRSGSIGVVTPFTASDEFGGPSGTVTQVVLVEAVVNDEEFVGNPLENWLVCGHATLAEDFDWTSGGTVDVAWASDHVLDVDSPEFFVPTLGGSTPPPSGSGNPFMVQLYLLDGDTRAWVDMNAFIINAATPVTFSMNSSMEGPFLHQQVGTMTFTLRNIDGKWDPLNLSGPWVVDGKTILKRGLAARVILPGFDNVPIWSGRVDVWPTGYVGDFYSAVTVVCVDGVSRLQAANLARLQVPQGAGESAGDRMNLVLDSIAWPGELRDIDNVHVVNTLQPTDLSDTAWAEMQQAADSDIGHLWVNGGRVSDEPDGTGLVIYTVRGRQEYEPGTDGGDPVHELLWFSMNGEDGSLIFDNAPGDTSNLYNLIKFTPTGGTEQAAHADTLDMTDEYGIQASSQTSLSMQTNRQAMDSALYQVGITRGAGFLFGSVTYVANDATDLDTWALLVGHTMFDRLRVSQVTPDTRTITEDQLIAGWTWRLTPGAYQVKYDLAPTDPAYPDVLADDDAAVADGCLADFPELVS